MRWSGVGDAGGGATRRLTVRRAVCGVLAGAVSLVGVVAGPATTALAQPSPDPETPGTEEEPELEVPDPVPGDEVCTITDPRLQELSGLVATDDQYIVVNDSQPEFGFDDRLPIFFLNQQCEVVDQQGFELVGRPRDPEDLELDRETGILWVADIGDNPAAGTGEGLPRDTIGLWSVDLNEGADRTPVIHRFGYPDGQPRDAEALLLDGDGTPLIVTKEVGTAGVYRPTDLVPNNPPEQAVPLELVGEFSPPDTGTDNPFQAAGRRFITGGAVSPDGTKAVLRTYADAFEFDVEDGDVVGAITTGQPRVTPLPGEPQGEAISYSPDGQSFLTVSDAPAEQVGSFTPVILRYTPTPPPPPEPPPADEAPPPESGSGGFSLVNSVQDIINLIAAVGVLGLLLVGVGVYGIVRARRRPPGAHPGRGDDPDGGDDRDGAPAGAPVRGRARLTDNGSRAESGWEPDQEPQQDPYQGPYQGPRQGPHQGERSRPAGVYTSAMATEYGGGEYGAAEYSGGEYGRGEYAGTEYGGADFRGAEHGAGGYGGTEYGGTEYGGTEYGGAEYGGTEYGGGPDHDWSDRDAGWDADPAQEPQPAPDYYSDDPDYRYEFRGRDR